MPAHCPDVPWMGPVTADAHLILGDGFGVDHPRSECCVWSIQRECKRRDERLPWIGVTRESAHHAFRPGFYPTRAAQSEALVWPADDSRLARQCAGSF
jgi:hypothetical protein